MKALWNKIFNNPSKEVSAYETTHHFNGVKDFIEYNNLKLYSIKSYIQNNSVLSKYDRNTREINIPRDFSEDPINKKIINKAEIIYEKNTLDTIIAHEFGHSIQHRALLKQESLGNWDIGKNGDICLTKFDGFNQKSNEAEDFFKADNSNPSGIERFMQQNFMESYADIYSGLVVYLKNDIKNIFDKIKLFRGNDKNEIKNSNKYSDFKEY